MKNLLKLIVVSMLLISCNKEEIKASESHFLEARIKFTAPYIANFYNDSVQSLHISVDGQQDFEFKTYLHDCNSRSFGYYVTSENETEAFEYIVRADGNIVDSGYLVFSERIEYTVK